MKYPLEIKAPRNHPLKTGSLTPGKFYRCVKNHDNPGMARGTPYDLTEGKVYLACCCDHPPYTYVVTDSGWVGKCTYAEFVPV